MSEKRWADMERHLRLHRTGSAPKSFTPVGMTAEQLDLCIEAVQAMNRRAPQGEPSDYPPDVQAAWDASVEQVHREMAAGASADVEALVGELEVNAKSLRFNERRLSELLTRAIAALRSRAGVDDDWGEDNWEEPE